MGRGGGVGGVQQPLLLSLPPFSTIFCFIFLIFHDFIFFRYRRENNRLTTDQSRLQATYREVENQSKFLTEKIARQQVCGSFDYCLRFAAILCLVQSIACAVFVPQTTLQGKIEREITEKKLTEDQVNKMDES